MLERMLIFLPLAMWIVAIAVVATTAEFAPVQVVALVCLVAAMRIIANRHRWA